MTRPPRYAAEISLPQHAFVPGHSPRPRQESPVTVASPLPRDFTARGWRYCSGYLYGVDLFNCGFYWEAHEAWETVWHAAKGSEPATSAIKGLIKLTAAGVKVRQGSETGRRRHARRAAELFRIAAASAQAAQQSPAPVLGLSLPWLVHKAAFVASREFAAPEPDALGAADAPATVFDFGLLLAFP